MAGLLLFGGVLYIILNQTRRIHYTGQHGSVVETRFHPSTITQSEALQFE